MAKGKHGPRSSSAQVRHGVNRSGTSVTKQEPTRAAANTANQEPRSTPAPAQAAAGAGERLASTAKPEPPQAAAGAGRQLAAPAAREPRAVTNQGQQRTASGARPQGRGAPRRRLQRTPWWRQSGTLISAAVVAVLIVVVIFVFAAYKPGGGAQSGSGTAQTAPTSVVSAVTGVSSQVSSAVGTGGLADPLQAVSGAAILKGSSGKPELLYMGAEYCPYCAAERWSMIVALSRFGTFKNLGLTTSSSTDVYPNTATFTFYKSSYSSPYLSFASVEETTRNPQTPLQTPTAQQQQLMSQYDAPPYSQSSGGIPFVDIGNQYVTSGAGYSPQLLAGLSQQQIAAKLSNPHDPVTQAIVGNANYLTAAICQMTGQQPGAVCSSASIQHIEQQLPKR
jgi:thiol-disulfide isomerase/thioredoxin